MSKLNFETMTLEDMKTAGIDAVMKSFDEFMDRNIQGTLNKLIDLGFIEDSEIIRK